MKTYTLNGPWEMTSSGGVKTAGTIPGSVYSFLLDAGEMEDPYFGDNELKALALMAEDYSFRRSFACPAEVLHAAHQILRFEGIDTLSEVILNGRSLGRTDNMHLAWEFDVRGLLKEDDNELIVNIESPTRYIAKMDEEYHLGGSTDAMRGFPHLRKAHCMFGWDWGPRLPDQGIWRDVKLLAYEDSRILEVRIRQAHFMADGTPAEGHPGHADAARSGGISVEITAEVVQSGDLPVEILLTSPAGDTMTLKNGEPFRVEKPALWWPNGLGAQPLYTVTARLLDPAGGAAEEVIKRIGLRTATMRREPDAWGETFATEVNGRTFFAMGADYIPEDCVLSRRSKARTARLLDDCVRAHFNAIRVWGGGFYPDDDFYDLCDELGLLVWQDFMFACANYRITPAFVDSIREEVRQNVRRIRHHACLGLLCGNNEMEQFALMKEVDGDETTAADYLIQNEFIIPEVLAKEAPDIFYWPSSPSSGGKYVEPWSPDRGDVHYWDVWHGNKPFTAYREFYFRYLSEFGFQSFPCIQTVESFARKEDQNIFSYVMEMHQRNQGANGKILNYLSSTYLYPTSFERLLYASQLLQAEAIRYGVEHFRRNRNDDRCMGAIYWQLNDNWPVASWASIDYFGRWKALHYYAARFFAPVLLSCEEEGIISEGKTCVSEPSAIKNTARLAVSNETWEEVRDIVEWSLCDEKSEVLASGSAEVTAAPFSSICLEKMDFSDYDAKRVHLSYRMKQAGSAGSVLFIQPKHYRFADPELSVTFDEAAGEITVKAACYAKSVEIYSEKGYILLSDNYFDMEAGTRTVKLLKGPTEGLMARSVYDIR